MYMGALAGEIKLFELRTSDKFEVQIGIWMKFATQKASSFDRCN